MNLLEFISRGNQVSGSGEGELSKVASFVAEKEDVLRKHAQEKQAFGKFMANGFVSGMMDKVAQEVTGKPTGVDNVNPPSAAQTPPKGGIELPSDAPGPGDVLKTTRPGGGEQHNNELYQKKLEEARLKAGLNDVQNDGVAAMSGSDHGTQAIFSLDHNQGGNQG